MRENPPRPISAVQESSPDEPKGLPINLQKYEVQEELPLEGGSRNKPEIHVDSNSWGASGRTPLDALGDLKSKIKEIDARKNWDAMKEKVRARFGKSSTESEPEAKDKKEEQPKKLFTAAELAEQISKRKGEDLEVAQRREVRAEKFADKFGLAEVRKAMLDAQHEAYTQEKRQYQSLAGRLSGIAQRDRTEARLKADKATLEWNKALANLPETASQRDRLEALIIRKRDTIIRANESRTQGKLDGLDERGKTLVGKVMNAPLLIGKKGIGVMGAASEAIGKGLYKIAGNKELQGEDLAREQAKYRRAGQILMGATIGTAMGIALAPGTVAAAGGAAAYAGFISVRSVLGVAAGKLTSNLAGFANKYLDTFKKEDYKKQVRNTEVDDIKALQAQQRSGARGSYEARQKFDRNVRVGAAVVGGGLTSFELGHAFHSLTSVQNAMHGHGGGIAENQSAQSPETKMSAGGTTGPAAHFDAVKPLSAAQVEKFHIEIEGAEESAGVHNSSQMFGHFGTVLEKGFANTPHADTPAIDTYLKLLHEHGGNLTQGEANLSHTFGFQGEHGLSEIMHKGDLIKLNEQHQVVIEWADHTRPPHVLIDADGGVNPDTDDLTKFMSGTHEHAATVHNADHSPKVENPINQEQPDVPQEFPEEINQKAVEALTTEHEGLLAQHEQLVATYENHGADYRTQLDAYNANLKTYNDHLSSYNTEHDAAFRAKLGISSDSLNAPKAAISHPVASPQPEVIPVAPPHEIQNVVSRPIDTPPAHVTTEAIPNIHGFNLKVDHGYEVMNSVTGKPDLVFYGPHGPKFMEELQKFAASHPGQKILLDSPEPTMLNGISQPWIATATYDPTSGFAIEAAPTNPAFAGTKLNPELFTKEIY